MESVINVLLSRSSEVEAAVEDERKQYSVDIKRRRALIAVGLR